MKEAIKLDTVDQYNRLFGLGTLHPLISIINLSEALRFPTHFTTNYGIYALFLENVKCGDIRYDGQTYDYQEGMVTSLAPEQVIEAEIQQGVKPDAHSLLFHPDLIKETSLGQDIKHYPFFSYTSAEAPHLSKEEKGIFIDCLEKIKMELQRPIGKYGKRLIPRNIGLLPDYCVQFYERQFVTRSESNKSILVKFKTLLDGYFQSDKLQTDGLPSVKCFADKVFLSPNYFGDLIKKGTGKGAQEYIQNRMADLAKEMITGTEKAVSRTAHELEFQYLQHFNRIFKKNVGYTPGECRKLRI